MRGKSTEYTVELYTMTSSFLHFIRTVVRVNDPRYGQLLLAFLLRSYLELCLPLLQKQVLWIISTELLKEEI